jgi:hypothetical protein
MQMVMRRLDLTWAWSLHFSAMLCHAMPAQSASFSFGGIGSGIGFETSINYFLEG